MTSGKNIHCYCARNDLIEEFRSLQNTSSVSISLWNFRNHSLPEQKNSDFLKCFLTGFSYINKTYARFYNAVYVKCSTSIHIKPQYYLIINILFYNIINVSQYQILEILNQKEICLKFNANNWINLCRIVKK